MQDLGFRAGSGPQLREVFRASFKCSAGLPREHNSLMKRYILKNIGPKKFCFKAYSLVEGYWVRVGCLWLLGAGFFVAEVPGQLWHHSIPLGLRV